MAQPRDLSGTTEDISRDIESHESRSEYAVRSTEDNPGNPYPYGLLAIPEHWARGLLCRYGRGDTLDELRRHLFQTYQPQLRHAARLALRYFPDHPLRMGTGQPASLALLFALVCFDDDGSQLEQPGLWFDLEDPPLLFDMLLHAFVPGHRYAARYNHKRTSMTHEQELVAALLQPRATWAAAFGDYMRRWPQLMQPEGYREQPVEGKHRFNQHALELGLAVCAYDVDDSGFRDRPYYPRDLVDYYRQHQRHGRDAWRGNASEAASELPESARPRPRKTYSRKPAQAYADWVDLVCGSDADLLVRARKALGKRKTMAQLDTVMEALAEAELAIRADIKDDATLAEQARLLCASHQLTLFHAPAQPPQGPARASAILQALRSHAEQHGRHLALLDDGSDSWQAVLCPLGDLQDFNELCEQLDIGLAGPDALQ